MVCAGQRRASAACCGLCSRRLSALLPSKALQCRPRLTSSRFGCSGCKGAVLIGWLCRAGLLNPWQGRARSACGRHQALLCSLSAVCAKLHAEALPCFGSASNPPSYAGPLVPTITQQCIHSSKQEGCNTQQKVYPCAATAARSTCRRRHSALWAGQCALQQAWLQ